MSLLKGAGLNQWLAEFKSAIIVDGRVQPLEPSAFARFARRLLALERAECQRAGLELCAIALSVHRTEDGTALMTQVSTLISAIDRRLRGRVADPSVGRDWRRFLGVGSA